MTQKPPLLSLCLTVDYPAKAGVLSSVSLEVGRGEVVALVGESGSGKSTLALAIVRLLGFKRGTASGILRFEDKDLLTLTESQMRRIRGREIALVLQSPLSSLNPALRIGTQLKEAWTAHRDSPSWRSQVSEMLTMVNLPADREFLARYPSQLSVGQAQRVLIAMAVLHRPRLLIADEPTSALDAITQAEILRLFRRLNQQLEMAILYISHDLLSVAQISDRIAILHRGRLLESGTVHEIFHSPQHSYTRQLIDSLPSRPDSVPTQPLQS